MHYSRLFILLLIGFVGTPAMGEAESRKALDVSIRTRSVKGDTWHLLVVVRSVRTAAGDDKPRIVTPKVQAKGAEVVSVRPAKAEISANERGWFFVRLKMDKSSQRADMTVRFEEAPGVKAAKGYFRPIDLTKASWQMWHAGKGIGIQDIKNPPKSAKWTDATIPDSFLKYVGMTWFRGRVVIPESLRGIDMALKIAGIDDNDVAFFNGQRIGATRGWDKPRNYVLPADRIRWGKENEICIAVESTSAPGGGIYKAPIQLAPVESPPLYSTRKQTEAERQKPRRLGKRLPLRPMVVRDGVLEYKDGGEVALWGINYYPFRHQQVVGKDFEKTIDQDFEDFARMGINVIRIHVFDVFISDAKGNLICNKKLDVLDYVVSKCSKHNIYLMLTPIAWWGNKGGFSAQIPIRAMSMWPEAWKIQENYFKQFLTHKNKYTGRRLVDEPCLALLEIINEPHYWSYDDIVKYKSGLGGADMSAMEKRAIDGIWKEWQKFAPAKDLRSPEVYVHFRYEMVRRYIDKMIDAMRSTGARQPIAYFYSYYYEKERPVGAYRALADSRADVITISTYPGGLSGDPRRGDRINKLVIGWAPPWDFSALMANKARVVYEFDACSSLTKIHLYPATAARFRYQGVQVAAQFQYDSRSQAHLNRNWTAHYLNLYHTPERTVSFMIGGELFRRMKRGTKYPTPKDDQVFGPAAVSWRNNAALLCAKDIYMQARPTKWRPLKLPKNPKRITTVGSCPYYDYEGTGIVDLRVKGKQATLWIAPDCERLRYSLKGTKDKPLSRLHRRAHPFRLRLDGWKSAKVERFKDGKWVAVSGTAGKFTATPGLYRLIK